MADYNPVDGFANSLLRELRSHHPEAQALTARVRGNKAIIGFTEDAEWVPLLRLSNPSAAANVMNLEVRHKRGWAPTFFRGIPSALVEHLAGPLAFTWQIPLTPWPPPPDDLDRNL